MFVPFPRDESSAIRSNARARFGATDVTRSTGPPRQLGQGSTRNQFLASHWEVSHLRDRQSLQTNRGADLVKILALCDDPHMVDKVRTIFEKRPELVERVESIRQHASLNFDDLDFQLERLKYDPWDAEVSLALNVYMDFDRYWVQREKLEEWLIQQTWHDDTDLGVSIYFAGDHR